MDICHFKFAEGIQSHYSTRKLCDITEKCASLDDLVELSLCKKEYPMMIKYRMGPLGSLVCYISPRYN